MTRASNVKIRPAPEGWVPPHRAAHKNVAVAEDWHPTIDGLVRVSHYQSTRFAMHRVCVWGGDDFGLEYDTRDGELARRLFDRINHLVTKSDLRSWGFINA